MARRVPQHIVRDLGGEISIQLPVRPDASPAPTVDLIGPDGTNYVTDGAVTVDSVNTTVSGAVAQGATSLTVASATGITAGREYLLGDGSGAPREMTRVRGITGSVVTLSRGTMRGHASGVAFVGTRLTYQVSSSEASALFWDGFARWAFSVGTVAREQFSSVECTLRGRRRIATLQDVYRREPKFSFQLDDEADVDEWLDTAYEDVLATMAGKDRVGTMIGDEGFIDATVYQLLANLAALHGPAGAEELTFWAERASQAIGQLKAVAPNDRDQDGFIEKHERAYDSVPFGRA